MTTLDGIDTSHFQSLTGQPLPPLRFATTKASEGGSFADPSFVKLLNFYRKTIPITGGYHFVAPGVPASDQFANFSKQCKAVGGCDIYQIDWEATVVKGISIFPDPKIVWELEDRCRQVWGNKVLMYSAPWVTGFAAWLTRPGRSPLWLADYGASGQANAKRFNAVVLQYTSSIQLAAFTGRVDGNTIISQAAWAAITGSHAPDNPTPQPIPQPPTPPIPGADTMIRILTVGDLAGKGTFTFDPSTGFHHLSGTVDACFAGRLTDVNMDRAAVAEVAALYSVTIPPELQ